MVHAGVMKSIGILPLFALLLSSCAALGGSSSGDSFYVVETNGGA